MATNFGFKPYSGSGSYVFISYSSHDSARIAPICRGLADNGVQLWYDAGLTAGFSWENQIVEKVRNSSLFLFFATKNVFQSSSYARKEYEMAKMFAKTVLVVYLDDINVKDISSDGMYIYFDICRLQGITYKNDNDKLIFEIYSAIDSLSSNSIISSPICKKQQNNNVMEELVNDENADQENAGQSYAERKIKVIKIIKTIGMLICLILLFFTLSYIAYNDANILNNLSSIINELKSNYLIVGIFGVIAIGFIMFINISINKAVDGFQRATEENTEDEKTSIQVNNDMVAKKLMKCLIPLALFDLVIYVSSFVHSTTNQVAFTFIILITSILGISSSVKIKSLLTVITDYSRIINMTKIMNLFILVFSTIVIFASIAHLIVIGNPLAYTPIAYSSWYHEAFVYLYHSFSMCIRNESDIAIPLNFLSQFISMMQMCICYFVILHEVSDIFVVKKNINYSL